MSHDNLITSVRVHRVRRWQEVVRQDGPDRGAVEGAEDVRLAGGGERRGGAGGLSRGGVGGGEGGQEAPAFAVHKQESGKRAGKKG